MSRGLSSPRIRKEREREREREREQRLAGTNCNLKKKKGRGVKQEIEEGSGRKIKRKEGKKKRQAGIIRQPLVKIARIWPAAIILGQTFVLSRCRVLRTVSSSPLAYTRFFVHRERGTGSVT